MVICGATNYRGQCERKDKYECFHNGAQFGLTKKAEPPPTRDVNRDSGTDSANGGWLRRLVRHRGQLLHNLNNRQNSRTESLSCRLI